MVNLSSCEIYEISSVGLGLESVVFFVHYPTGISVHTAPSKLARLCNRTINVERLIVDLLLKIEYYENGRNPRIEIEEKSINNND